MSNYYSFVFSLMALTDTNISNTFQPMMPNVPIYSMGLGTFSVRDDEQFLTALNRALEVGYRHFDTSPLYENEHIIGKVLKKWTSSKKLKRRDLFVATKLHPLDMDPDKVEMALKTSLSKLQLSYVDSYLLHMPIALKRGRYGDFVTVPSVNLTAIWKKMEEQVRANRTRSIGLRDFNKNQIEHILNTAKIPPSNLHIEVHPYFQQKKLREYCRKHNILVVGYAPLATSEYNKYSRERNNKYFDILEDPEIVKIAKKYRKTPAQIVLRYLHQLHVAIIPRSLNASMLKQMSKIFNFNLMVNDMRKIEALDKGDAGRIYDMANYASDIVNHPDYPFKEHVNIMQAEITPYEYNQQITF